MTHSASHTISDASLNSEDAAIGLLEAPVPPEAVAEVGEVTDVQTENRLLREQIAYVLAQAAYNHQVMCRHQAFDLEIVGASSFPQLITSIFQTLPKISDLQVVTLTLLDQDADIHTVMRNLGVDFDDFPQLIFVDNSAELGPFLPAASSTADATDANSLPSEQPCRPLLGCFDEERHRGNFPFLSQTPASVAIVPLLRNRSLIGSLNLGSSDVQRFSANLGTDFIEHMASIIAICLENVISNELLKYIGLTDSLTGVYNRRYVDRRLLEEVARARRAGYQFSCMYIDIDHFKHVNDSVGHLGGDEVLREVAGRIKAELRQSDALGRFGGEEFVVLLIDADMTSAMTVAERIRASMEEKQFVLSTGIDLRVTVSIGVATLSNELQGDTIENIALQLLAKADHALYEAKQSGRNRVIRFQ